MDRGENGAYELSSILKLFDRDYYVRNNGDQGPVSEFEGKIVGLYFSSSTYPGCKEFTQKLVQVYENLKEKTNNFEILMVSIDDYEESFNLAFKDMPWCALPYENMLCCLLMDYFNCDMLPALLIFGTDGKILHPNVVEAIEYYGAEAFPFTPERFIELQKMDMEKEEAQTLESILTSGELDYVIDNSGAKISVYDLVGKTILLYFAPPWRPRNFNILPIFIREYNKIKANYDADFEVIFICTDRDKTYFDSSFSKMPWLAVPFGDERNQSLSRIFKVKDIMKKKSLPPCLGVTFKKVKKDDPVKRRLWGRRRTFAVKNKGKPMIVAIGPNGKTVMKEARDVILRYGAEAYPFTQEIIKELKAAEYIDRRS